VTSPHRYLLLFKPDGVLTQFSGPDPAQTLASLVPVPGVYPVGRLDSDSEGLLLLTDDGPLAHRLTDPRHAHPRTYWVQVEGVPSDEALDRLARGVVIQGVLTLPARVRRLEGEPDLPPRPRPIRERRHIPTTWIELVLTEGRNRQVRRMTASVGHPTLRLVRVAIGPLRLDGLRPGEWRWMTEDELALLVRGIRPGGRRSPRPRRSR
jgi:23S rRNA pseudouridine2457 synthase